MTLEEHYKGETGDERARLLSGAPTRNFSDWMYSTLTRVTAERDALKCCGNCYHYDIIMDYGGVCCYDPDRVPADRDAKCDTWERNSISRIAEYLRVTAERDELIKLWQSFDQCSQRSYDDVEKYLADMLNIKCNAISRIEEGK